jgi:hypothetical protein
MSILLTHSLSTLVRRYVADGCGAGDRTMEVLFTLDSGAPMALSRNLNAGREKPEVQD